MNSKVTRGIDIRKVHGNAWRPGLTNGLTNGMTNGLSNRALRRTGDKEGKHGKIFAVVVLCFLVLGVFAVLTYQSQQRNTIAIDGNFED